MSIKNRHDPAWKARMASVARYDRVKFRFRDCGPAFVAAMDEVLGRAYATLLDRCKGMDIRAPKRTILPASMSKPEGLLIYELNGLCAEAVRYLPAGWLMDATYVDVKSFVRLAPEVGSFDEGFGSILNVEGGRRMLSTRRYPRASKDGAKRSGMVYTLGSGKSGLHLNAYMRPGQPVGIEGKYRDEAVASVAQRALEMYSGGILTDAGAWDVALRDWAYISAQAWEAELLYRDYDACAVMEPVSFGVSHRERVVDTNDDQALNDELREDIGNAA